jgi:integrase
MERIPPVVVVLAQNAKGRREEPIPLPDHLVQFLSVWLKNKSAREKLWPGTWAHYHSQAIWLKRDCKRAKLGEGITFHGLKRRYVTGLIRIGNDPDEVRRLARHRHLTTTMNYYAESNLPDLAKAVNRVPPPRPAE